MARLTGEFHVALNVALAVVFLPLLDPLATMLIKLLPARKTVLDPSAPRYLDKSALDTPSLALANAARETLHMGDTVEAMLKQVMTALMANDRTLVAGVASMDNIVDSLNEAIKLYLTKLTRSNLDESEAKRAMEILSFAINLEHVGDIIEKNLSELAAKKIKRNVKFSDDGATEIVKQGQRVVVEVRNDTDTPELVHWHGQTIPSEVDGAAEEGSPYVPAHGMSRIAFVPGPSGFRFYHTHVVAGADLNRGTYSGQFGPAYIEPKDDPGAYDREVFLVLKEFNPSFSRGGDMASDALVGTPIKALQQMGSAADEEAKDKTKGYEVSYELFSINGRMLGQGDPIRVKMGERVLFHVLNASATEIRSLALPGHVFRVVALDGNPVPTPANVPVLWLGTAERISAIVEMRHPGVWIMGDLADDDRGHGMGVVVEYDGKNGKPQWLKPKPFHWDYTQFGKRDIAPMAPDETIQMTIVKHNAAEHGFNRWSS